jgi:hypothetical protein
MTKQDKIKRLEGILQELLNEWRGCQVTLKSVTERYNKVFYELEDLKKEDSNESDS